MAALLFPMKKLLRNPDAAAIGAPDGVITVRMPSTDYCITDGPLLEIQSPGSATSIEIDFAAPPPCSRNLNRRRSTVSAALSCLKGF